MIRLALTLVLALWPTPVAVADPTDLSSDLSSAGVEHNPAGAERAGRAVCDLATQGVDPLEIVSLVVDANPGMSMEDAARFAVISALHLCPSML